VGLARGAFHFPGGNGKEGAPSFNGACTVTSSILCALRPSPFFTRFFFSVFCVQFGEKWWYRHCCAIGGVFNILMMMGANLVGFVVGMDGAQYLAYHIVSSWSGESLPSRCTVLSFTYVRRYSLPPRRMCLPVRRRTAHVRVPVCSFVYV